MSCDLVSSPLCLAAIGLATLGAILLLAGIVALVRRRALRRPHRPLPGAGTAGGPLRAAPALRVPRAAARRRVRLGDVRAGDAARRARAARLDERPADPRRAADVELGDRWTNRSGFLSAVLVVSENPKRL